MLRWQHEYFFLLNIMIFLIKIYGYTIFHVNVYQRYHKNFLGSIGTIGSKERQQVIWFELKLNKVSDFGWLWNLHNPLFLSITLNYSIFIFIFYQYWKHTANKINYHIHLYIWVEIFSLNYVFVFILCCFFLSYHD